MDALTGGMMAVLASAFGQKPKACPECATPVPQVRKPATRRQALRGGWTCPTCGCEIDRRVQRLAADR